MLVRQELYCLGYTSIKLFRSNESGNVTADSTEIKRDYKKILT
jgi:hypothetical protein